MNKRISLYLLISSYLFISPFKSFSQDPVVEWENTIGGTNNDYLKSSCTTSDGGYLLGGYSKSGISGDKTEGSLGGVIGYDYWVIKLNSSGAIEWQNTIGSNADDYLVDVVEALDGGFLIGGYTTGGISGDKTESAIGDKDYWLVKINSTGTIVWQNTIGGSSEDVLTNIEPVPSGGFLLSGYSASGISGDKTEAAIGVSYDYWLVKINPLGSIQWQYTIGGLENDYLMATLKTAAGNYILGGYSFSGISGDKTEAAVGNTDYWILEIDGSGNIIWQNTIGGSDGDYFTDFVKLDNNQYLLAGYSRSNNTGDKTEWSNNELVWCCEAGESFYEDSEDYWLVMIDSTGNIIWDNTIGTSHDDKLRAICRITDNKILVTGSTGRYASFDKTDYTDGLEYWLIEIDSNGYISWQDALAGNATYDPYEDFIENGYNYSQSLLSTPDGGIFIAGYSNALSGYDKSEDCIGGGELYDYWVIKLGPDTCSAQPIYADYDHDDNGSLQLSSTCEYTVGPFVSNNDDCDDSRSYVYPSAPEICDGFDNNCNGLTDEGIIDCDPGPSIQWDRTIGGTDTETFTSTVNTSDGGFLIGGSSKSTDGDITFNNGEYDYFILKLMSDGTTAWKRTIGGSASDYLYSIHNTSDGGFIVGGYSSSGISGDKTEANLGGPDYWVLKLDPAGNIEWQNTIGGSGSDYLTEVRQTADGGFIAAGRSYSGISGDKTEMNYGSSDYWVVKMDASGNILWQNTFGGSARDELKDICQSSTGEYIIVGNSQSPVSGEKTTINFGSNDFWILKLDATGGILWQKEKGGTSGDTPEKVIQTSDGNFIIAGTSSSGISAMKSEASISDDGWIIKMNPSGGTIWENTIQGESDDHLADLVETADGNLLVGGSSSSIIGYDKTEPCINGYWSSNYVDFNRNHDYWLIQFDNTGNIIWQNSFGGNLDDDMISLSLTTEGRILAGGTSYSFKMADKTENNHGGIEEVIDDFGEGYNADADFWIVELEGVCIPTAESCNSVDDNCNGLIDDAVIETISISAGGATTFCEGNTVLLSATYSGASIQWKKNGSDIPGAVASTYSVNKTGNYSAVTTSPCATATSSTISVTVNKNPNASISAGGATTFCAGGSVTLTEIPVAGSTFQWYKGASLIAGATSTNYIATTAGNYKCRVTKIATGCYKNSNAISVTVPCKEGGLSVVSGELEFKILPNPNNGVFEISVQNLAPASPFFEGGLRGMKIDLFNSLGQLIYTQQINSPDNNFTETITLDNISSGIYFVRVGDGNNYSEQKLIIE